MGMPLPKQFTAIRGVPVLVRTVRCFLKIDAIRPVIVALPAGHMETAGEMFRSFLPPDQAKKLILVAGGATRQESVLAGIRSLPPESNIILVHDGARPFVTREIIERCLAEAAGSGAAVAAVPVRDTIKRVNLSGVIGATVDRENLWQAQTPQAFRREMLEKAYALAEKDGFQGTDEASLLEHAGCSVKVVQGSEHNLKITRPDDLRIAEGLLEEAAMKIGHGFDAHRLESGRPLVLGGVTIPYERGLEGHSDADVLIHALIDSLLGAMGEGDIGSRFPDRDPQYRNISSLKLLQQVADTLRSGNYTIGNADMTVICQQPRLAPYIDRMRENIAAVCRRNKEAFNIKATTTEMMGFTGRGEGIAAHAVVLLRSGGDNFVHDKASGNEN